MVSAIKLTKQTIKCDTCNFRVDGKPVEWLNKPCPKCGAENIITDKDMDNYHAIMGVVGLVNGLAGDIEEGHSVTIAIDTAGLK